MSLRTFCKNVRFDVQVKEEAPEKGRYFDIELQMIDTGEFPKRALLPGKGMSVYKFQNREETDPCILMGDLCYTFRRYSDIKDESTREYMQYFATQKHESAKMKRIHKLVERYRRDPITRKAYMTLEQELEIRYKKKGLSDKNKEFAKAFRDRGVSIEIIEASTGLTPEEIKAL